MGHALPSGLSVADLMANLPCNWFRISKAKRRPSVRYACKFCHRISRDQTCVMNQSPGASVDWSLSPSTGAGERQNIGSSQD